MKIATKNNLSPEALSQQHHHRGDLLPHITVSSVLKRAGKYLIVEEHTARGILFNQPSGHVDKRESAIDGVIRETFEETGWRFQPTSIIGIYFYHSANSDTTYQRICFTGDLIAEDPKAILDEVIVKPHWLSREELIELDKQDKLRSELVLRCIDDFIAGKRLPLDTLTNLF